MNRYVACLMLSMGMLIGGWSSANAAPQEWRDPITGMEFVWIPKGCFQMGSPATEKDVLLTTHSHADHVDTRFFEAFPGKQLKHEVGEIKIPDVTIQGIAVAHSATDKILIQ